MTQQTYPLETLVAIERIEKVLIKKCPLNALGLPDVAPSEVLSQADFVFYRDFKLSEWEAQKKALEVAKELEMQLRKQVVAFAFDPKKESGTERVELGGGYQLKAVKKINYGWKKAEDGTSVDKAAIENALLKIEQTGPVGEHIAAKLVKWTPTLSKTEYDDLDKDLKAIIDEVIVTDSGAPTLEIVEPKSKK